MIVPMVHSGEYIDVIGGGLKKRLWERKRVKGVERQANVGEIVWAISICLGEREGRGSTVELGCHRLSVSVGEYTAGPCSAPTQIDNMYITFLHSKKRSFLLSLLCVFFWPSSQDSVGGQVTTTVVFVCDVNKRGRHDRMEEDEEEGEGKGREGENRLNRDTLKKKNRSTHPPPPCLVFGFDRQLSLFATPKERIRGEMPTGECEKSEEQRCVRWRIEEQVWETGEENHPIENSTKNLRFVHCSKGSCAYFLEEGVFLIRVGSHLCVSRERFCVQAPRKKIVSISA